MHLKHFQMSIWRRQRENSITHNYPDTYPRLGITTFHRTPYSKSSWPDELLATSTLVTRYGPTQSGICGPGFVVAPEVRFRPSGRSRSSQRLSISLSHFPRILHHHPDRYAPVPTSIITESVSHRWLLKTFRSTGAHDQKLARIYS